MDTGLVSFSVESESPALGTTFELRSNGDEGTVTVSSSIIAISGKSEGGDVEYVTHGGKQCARISDGVSVLFDSGFRLSGDYVFDTSVYLTETNACLMRVSSPNVMIEIRILDGMYDTDGDTVEGCCLALKVTVGYFSYVVHSSVISIGTGDKVRFIWKRVGSLYSIDWVTEESE